MPRSPIAHGAGNVNMKGKKSRMMRCMCCECIDFRDKEMLKQHNKEVLDYRRRTDEDRI